MSNIAEPRASEAATRIAPTIPGIAAIGYGVCKDLLRRISRDQSGATAITTALVLVVLVGFVGLGTEVGMWYAERRAMQNASDAAALGAGFDIYKNGKKSTGIVEAGLTDSAKNGFTDGQNNVTVTVNYPPKQGKYANKNTAVETVVSKTRASLFASFFLDGPVDISVRSVATIKYIGVYCILALSPHDEAALLFEGTADVQLKNCGINVNSDDGDGAMTAKGASVVGATYADIVGGLNQTNNADLDLGEINTGADAIDDPYANLDIPGGSGCDYTDFTVGPSKTKTLSPGRYCNGLKIQGTAYLQAGEYVIVGGTFDVASTAHVTTDTEDGVTIFLTGSGSDYAKVTINGGAHIDIVATTDGEYKGLAFFQDRDAPVINSGSPNKLNGGSNMTITGAIYFPKQRLSFSGNNGNEGTCTRIVAYMIDFSGTSGLNTDCPYGFGEQQTWPPVLAE
ncbi:MAG TPA: pilus assembly protein TadG-related protein [Dongiaceae bacterium]|nr:pilus assembly protein TadG-related protein [Dongiaceae bacterium]